MALRLPPFSVVVVSAWMGDLRTRNGRRPAAIDAPPSMTWLDIGTPAGLHAATYARLRQLGQSDWGTAAGLQVKTTASVIHGDVRGEVLVEPGVTIRVDDKSVASGQVPNGMSLHFTSYATFDLGQDIDSPVSNAYYEKAPFPFNGAIGRTHIKYTGQD